MPPIHKHYQRLVLENPISKGAFAEVYKGRIYDYRQNVYRVAVKVLKKRWVDKQDIINRLEDEADLLAQLNHSNIISALGFTDIEERPSIIMEYIDGVDLKTLLKNVQLPPNLCFHIAARVAAALHSAYTHTLPGSTEPLAVIHRDIKPSNVMLTRDKNIKVLDFGASRFNHKARKGQTTVFTYGSPKYMSNERKKGDRGSHSSDIYSLGIMLIELLNGRTLTQNPPNNQQKHDRFIEHIVSKISLQLPSPEWDKRARQLLIRMCAFWKNHRFTAEECVQLLSAFAQHAKGGDQRIFWERHVLPIIDLSQTAQPSSLESSSLKPGMTILLDPKSKKKIELSFTPKNTFSNPKIIPSNKKSPEIPSFLRTTVPPEADPIQVFLQEEKTPPLVTSPHTPPRREKPIPSSPSKQRPDVQKKTTSNILPKVINTENKSFSTKNIVLMTTCAAITFCFLHVLTFSGLALSKKTDVLFPANPSTPNEIKTEPEEKISFDVLLEIDSQEFISLTITDDKDENKENVNRKKTKKTIRLVQGEYKLLAKERSSKTTKSIQYQISKKTEIYCGVPDGDIPTCIDHNDNTLLIFEDSEE